MKSQMLVAASTVCLLAVPGIARTKTTQQETQPTTRPALEKSAGPPPPTDRDSGYGGVPASTSVAARGHRQGTCKAAPNCDEIFGQQMHASGGRWRRRKPPTGVTIGCGGPLTDEIVPDRRVCERCHH